MAYKSDEVRREYNRRRAADQYAQYVQRRDALMEREFQNECYLCLKVAGKHFHLHHFIYHETESDYPRNGRSLYLRLKRLTEAEQHPERFRLLCAGCHHYLEGIRAMINVEKLDRARVLELVNI